LLSVIAHIILHFSCYHYNWEANATLFQKIEDPK
jgi:hypothetical protein